MKGAEVYLSREAAKDRRSLDTLQERKLLVLAKRLVQDVTLGDQLRRELIPPSLRKAYACDNLWRLELPGAWRLLYTIQSRPDEATTVSVLRILSHKDYDRLFGYRTS